ncbi:hypothetical protein PROFUN_03036 [Planoprotostelium fungivorum]|uniref:Methylisocitrate lyase n=1 Tax=Planoprotostelium fungivorum TaxID=1890364 RepID=A0A2P6NXD1_9EUKA|nr:hypothetical protein PROFUN_03036 [Planoprotostelium fungivorum]
MAARLASPGTLFRTAVKVNKPLQIPGAVNAYTAMLAEHSGFHALYLSGSGVAAASYGLPDLGITSLNDVVEDVRRITRACKLPLLVDIDTGFGPTAFHIKRAVQEIEAAGAAAVHLEDQASVKRCGHRPNKQIVPEDEMVDRIRAAVDGRTDPNFVIMARTDALANEGIDSALKRSKAYIAAGADMLFPEALNELSQYKIFSDALPGVPILANITEFGKTPMFTTEELAGVGVGMVLYPLSAFRAQSAAALKVYDAIRDKGTQSDVLSIMQTREELYQHLGYHAYEEKMDALFGKK